MDARHFPTRPPLAVDLPLAGEGGGRVLAAQTIGFENGAGLLGGGGARVLAVQEDGELRPKKDKYSNLCDCLQYGCLSLGEGRRMIGLTPAHELKGVQTWGRKRDREHKTMRRVWV